MHKKNKGTSLGNVQKQKKLLKYLVEFFNRFFKKIPVMFLFFLFFSWVSSINHPRIPPKIRTRFPEIIDYYILQQSFIKLISQIFPEIKRNCHQIRKKNSIDLFQYLFHNFKLLSIFCTQTSSRKIAKDFSGMSHRKFS